VTKILKFSLRIAKVKNTSFRKVRIKSTKMEVQTIRNNFYRNVQEFFEWLKTRIVNWLGVPPDYQYDYWYLRENIQECYSLIKKLQRESERETCVHNHHLCHTRYITLEKKVKMLEERLRKFE